MRRLLALACVLMLAGVAVGIGPVAGTSQQSDCQTVVTHDALMTDAGKIDTLANGTTVETTTQNTKVTVGTANSFYRITGENPNGYCVRLVVKADEEAVPPAELPGTVSADNADIEATWDATHDFEADRTYTKIAFTLPPETTASFSPNQARIFSMSWVTERAEQSKSAWEEVLPDFSSSSVEKHTYEIAADGSARVVVPLENATNGQSIDDWRALAKAPSVEGYSSWRDAGQDASDPVYYGETQNGTAVAFHFSEAARDDAVVKFYANPGFRANLDYQLKSYLSGLDMLGDFSLFGGTLLPVMLRRRRAT